MNEEQRLIYVRGILLQAEIRMNGMIAENKQREVLGQSMAHDENAFTALIDEFGLTHNALITEICGH